MDTCWNRSRRWIGCTLFSASLMASAAAGAVTYGPGGLPDLSAYRVNEANFAAMAQGLGTPRDLTTDGGNEVSKAIWWLPAQGYAAPARSRTIPRWGGLRTFGGDRAPTNDLASSDASSICALRRVRTLSMERDSEERFKERVP